jgi:hypothetical protein
MWIGDAVYFASDRDGPLNLYSWDPKTDAVTKLTSSTTWDVRWPSSDNVSRIVYELDGELQVFDVKTRPTRRCRSSSRTTASPCGRRGWAPRSKSRASSSDRRASGPFSSRAATSSPSDREGSHPQPHGHLVAPRQARPLVAGRQADRLRLRPQRRGRDLGRGPGRRHAGAADEGPGGDEIRPGIVGGGHAHRRPRPPARAGGRGAREEDGRRADAAARAAAGPRQGKVAPAGRRGARGSSCSSCQPTPRRPTAPSSRTWRWDNHRGLVSARRLRRGCWRAAPAAFARHRA